jgi:hypothetical protein
MRSSFVSSGGLGSGARFGRGCCALRVGGPSRCRRAQSCSLRFQGGSGAQRCRRIARCRCCVGHSLARAREGLQQVPHR